MHCLVSWTIYFISWDLVFRKTLPLRNVLFYKIDRANSRAKLTENIFFLIKICPFYTIIRGHLFSKNYAEHTFTFSKVLQYFDNFLRQKFSNNLLWKFYEVIRTKISLNYVSNHIVTLLRNFAKVKKLINIFYVFRESSCSQFTVVEREIIWRTDR